MVRSPSSASRMLAGLTTRVRGGRGVVQGPTTTHEPIEKVASNARRLRHLHETLPSGTSFVRAVGVARAYDYVLAMACEQLEVPTPLLELPDGKPRILERLRVEFLLGECGLQI